MRTDTGRPWILALVAALVAVSASNARAQTALCDVPITMSDGVVLRANVWLPAETSTRVPAVLTVTGYNKDLTNAPGQCSTAGITGVDLSLTDKGYAVVAVDDRGTGASGGGWDSWGERTQQDYQEVLDWLQAQPWSDGSAVTTGSSYMGITSLLVAEADAARVKLGKPRAVKAVWADVPMADAYRDVTFQGGALNTAFVPLWLGQTTAFSAPPPSTIAMDPAAGAQTYVGHVANAKPFQADHAASMATGGDYAYDSDFYRVRSPIERAADITVPVVIQGGWFDIFQRGAPLLYEHLVHSPHRKLIMSPHYHLTTGPPLEDPDLKQKWFDHWLKNADNGAEDAPSISLYPIGGDRWEHPARFPAPDVRYTSMYLNGESSGSSPTSRHDGSLVTSASKVPGAESQPLLPASSPCSRLLAQWSAGKAAGTPCETDNRTYEATGLTYTTAPLAKPLHLSGPVTANLWVKATTTDAMVLAVLSDVAPDGTSTQLTAGFLLSSMRKVNLTKSDFGPGHLLIRPYHDYTQASQEPMVGGKPTLLNIEIFATDALLAPGHRLRLTINTADSGVTTVPARAFTNTVGGTLDLLHGPDYESEVLLPLAD